jgi:hypothetical protein
MAESYGNTDCSLQSKTPDKCMFSELVFVCLSKEVLEE